MKYYAVAEIAPHEKGKVERFFRTLDEEFLALQPHFTGAPKSAAGRRYGPNCDPVSLKRLAGEVLAWIDTYNRERPHSALGRRTPLEQWCACLGCRSC